MFNIVVGIQSLIYTISNFLFVSLGSIRVEKDMNQSQIKHELHKRKECQHNILMVKSIANSFHKSDDKRKLEI